MRVFTIVSILLSISISSCDNSNKRQYRGKILEINYLNIDNFSEEDWIELDGVKFPHERYESELMKRKYVLPTSEIVRDSLTKNTKAPFNSLNIAITLGELIQNINRNNEFSVSAHDEEYIISNKPLLLTKGMIKFHKKDSSVIHVSTSKDYPAQVKVSDFE